MRDPSTLQTPPATRPPRPAPDLGAVPRSVGRTIGQKMLCEAPGTYDQLMHQLAVSRQSLSDWRKGVRLPSVSARRRMSNVLGIPVDAWEQPWAYDLTQPQARDADAVPPPAPPPPVMVGGTTIEQCLGLLATIRHERTQPNLLSSEKVKLVDSESKLLKLLADLQQRAELTEDRYVREHPAWMRARNAIAEALKPHPAAAQAVAAALERLGL